MISFENVCYYLSLRDYTVSASLTEGNLQCNRRNEYGFTVYS